MKCVITVDTEADDQWSSSEVMLKNIDALKRFQEFMERRNVPPTYLVSHEVLEHSYMKVLGEKHREGLAEIGGHLHPWTTPPLDALDESLQRFPCELPADVLAAKLSVLTDAIKNLIGEQPLSFRAGKWGLNDQVLSAIYENGYRIDSSITPGIVWSDVIKNPKAHKEVPDFKGKGAVPYMDASGVYEVPMSVLKTGIYKGTLLDGVLFKKSIVGKAARVLTRPTWFRIFRETNIEDLKRVIHVAKKYNYPLVFMIHSSELMAGTSPYVKDGEAVEHVYALLDECITLLQNESTSFVRLQDMR